MRVLRRIALIIVSFCLLISVAIAHPGNTDSQGGHTDKSSGEYHYHHGYPAHYHTNGVCPYDFDDKTGWNSGQSSSKNQENKDNTNEEAKAEEEKVETANRKEQEQSLFDWVAFVVSIGAFGLLIVVPIVVTALFVVVVPIVLVLDRLHLFDAIRKRNYEKKRQEALRFFDGKSARELANVPDGVMFSGDHWPISINGYNLLVCPNSGRTKYHKQTCRYAIGIRPVSVYSLDSSFEPCGICKPIKFAGKPQWLTDYRKYIDQKRKYQIEDPDLPDNH